ncbi:hypothetical protein B566_EDAN015462 [Ephemera danica]|nr:hypothetical protein B566_EDAN015462 [Ephemera danica]
MYVLSKPVPLLPPPPSASSSTPRVQTACDLISLAEKGKVGPSSSSAASSSSSSSSTASSTSGDEEQQQLHQKALRHRETTRAAIAAAPAAGYRKLVKPTDEEAPPLSPTSAYQDSIPDPECVVVQTDLEPLFDVTDLQNRRESAAITSQPVSKCGQLELAFAYDAPGRKMTVHVLQARDVPSKDRGGSSHTQVRLVMLPTKKQKHKTKIRQGENPQFMESFLLHRVNPEDVNSMGVRLRLYGCERMRRERLIGEYVVGFAGLNLELETTMWLPLEARANLAASSSASELLSLARSDSTGSTHSMQMMQHGGVAELLLGLSYNGTTGRLSVEIVKGSHFRTMAMTRAPDSYVKLCLVALFQLPDVTLMISVYNKRSMKRKEMLGWFSLGLSSTGHEEMAHWADMRDNRCEQVCRWHVLIDS